MLSTNTEHWWRGKAKRARRRRRRRGKRSAVLSFSAPFGVWYIQIGGVWLVGICLAVCVPEPRRFLYRLKRRIHISNARILFNIQVHALKLILSGQCIRRQNTNSRRSNKLIARLFYYLFVYFFLFKVIFIRLFVFASNTYWRASDLAERKQFTLAVRRVAH